jgi:hypothetical protein
VQHGFARRPSSAGSPEREGENGPRRATVSRRVPHRLFDDRRARPVTPGARGERWRAPCPSRAISDDTAIRDVTSNPLALRRRALLAALVVAVACGGDDAPGADSAASAAAATIAPPATPYREIPLSAVGRVRGRVLGDEPRARGTPAPAAPREGEPACADSTEDTGTPGIDGGLAGAVVWLRDARQGKALPLERRYTLTNRGCRLLPHVQATLAGGTLNIRSLDPIEHRTRLVRQGDSLPVAVVPEYDEGQVVPNEQVLERPALVHATCELHSWSEAWIAVFDHPYYAVTTPDGAFAIDSIPPGTYRLVVWHERKGTKEREVVVRAAEIVADVKLD